MDAHRNSYEDAFNLLCGRKLSATGMSRMVFNCTIRPDLVCKVESDDIRDYFQNIIEWNLWEHVKWTDHAKWFAPCEYLSPDGRILLMRKTLPALKYPPKLPVYLTDCKKSNYGMLGNKFVCHDYGTHLMLENGMSHRLRKVDWTDG